MTKEARTGKDEAPRAGKGFGLRISAFIRYSSFPTLFRPRMNKGLTVVLLLAAGVALVLRCPRLDERPMHNDEAVNAIKFGQLWEHDAYKYDPNEHHGPTLYYA